MPKRILQGTVVSTAAQKTIAISVERRFMHPMYKKYITRSKKYLAHNEDAVVNNGDVVRIIECRPISKRKTWQYLDTISQAVVAG